MLITKEKTKYHEYAFSFDYDRSVIEFCQYLKVILGWTQFQYDPENQKWRFKDPSIVSMLKNKFPFLVLGNDIQKDVDAFLRKKEEEKEKEQNARRIKQAKISTLEIKGIKGKLYDYQKLGVEFFINSGGRAILADEMGTGKEQSIFSKVLTPNGWVMMGEIKVGDYVIGQNGKPTKVLGVFPQGIKKMYRFKLRDGSSVLCGLEHLWAVKNYNRIKRKKDWDILTTKELLSRKLKKGGTKKNNYMIPFAVPVENDQKTFEIEPYTLGVLLGDGSLTQSSIYMTLSPQKKHVLKKVKNENPEYFFSTRPGNGCSAYAFTAGMRGTTPNKIIRALSKLNLRIHSAKRFIPEIYKQGSVNQRLSILRGLMDTDGSAYLNRINYHTVSKKLAYDVAEIVRSLGGEAIIRSYYRKDKTYGTEYSVNVKLPHECPFSIESPKARHWKPAGNRKWYGRMIDSIEYEKEEEAVCIAVEAADHLYITEDYIVTHNTVQSLAYIVNTNQRRTLIICPASVKFSWQNEIKKWTKLNSYVVDTETEFSEIPHDTDIVIINYDILKKFFNELMKYGWSCLVADESHFIKNHQAIRSKAVKAIAQGVPSVLLLSGTPLINRPIELFNLLNIIDPKAWPNWYQYAVRYAGGKKTRFGFEANGATNLEELKQKIEKYFLRRTKNQVLAQLPPKVRTEVPMELSGEFQQQYKIAASDLAQYLKRYKKETDANILKTVQSEKLARINYLRQINSMGKIKIAKELIENFIENDEKVLVFSCFNAPLLELQKSFQEKSVMIIGSTDVNERGEIVKNFQENPDIKVFLGGVNSAGTGITLTAAKNIVFLDFPWTPGDMKQAEDRAHRPGANYESLNIYQITSRGTIDDFMKKLLVEKQEIFDKLFEGKQGKTQKSILDEMVEDIENKY